MAVNKIQLAVNYRKNNDAKSAQYGHYYAEVDTRKTLTTDGLVEHIMGHNVAVGPEAVAAVLKVMAECIFHQLIFLRLLNHIYVITDGRLE